MKTIYATASKGGREHEKYFTTQLRADADLWLKDYYMGVVVKVEVSDEEYAEIYQYEKDCDAEAGAWGDMTDVDKYECFLRGWVA